MVIYFLGLSLSVIISIFIEKLKGFNNKKTIKMFISILPLTIISAFRYDVGWDYLKIYTTGFYMVGEYGRDWFTEGLFRLIIKILFSMFENPWSLFILFSVLISVFFSLCYSRYGKNKNAYVYIILFVISRYYFCSLNIMRQALAMLIVLFSLKYIVEKKFLKYFLSILLAGGFHYTSYIFLPLYFILGRNLKIKKNLFIVLLAIPILLLLGIFFIFKTKYVKYFYTMFGNDGTIYYSELFISLIIIFIGMLYYKKIKEDNILLCMFNMEIIALMMSVISFILPIGDRIIWMFTIVNLFFIPNLLNKIESKKIKMLISSSMYGALLVVFFMQTLYTDSYSILPYQNIFQK